MQKILLVFAHPDDESFTAGGTIAKYARSGWQIDLVCATGGEAAATAKQEISTAQLKDLRTKELDVAAEILGINSVTLFDYADGALDRLNPGELEDKIFWRMISLAPDIVITFNTTGISNHPDHIKISYATTFAFQKYASVASEVRQMRLGIKPFPRHAREAWKLKFAQIIADTEPKLYYACIPQSLVEHLLKQKLLPRESFGKPWQGTPDKAISTVIEIKLFRNFKLRALKAHASQRSDVERFLMFLGEPFLQRENFILRRRGTAEVFMGKNDSISRRL